MLTQYPLAQQSSIVSATQSPDDIKYLKSAIEKHSHSKLINENFGNSTGTGAEQTIAHGLGVTPNYVCLTEYNTGAALPYESTTADSTNIYITAVLNKTYRWYVRLIV